LNPNYAGLKYNSKLSWKSASGNREYCSSIWVVLLILEVKGDVNRNLGGNMAPLNTDPAFEQFQSVPDIRGIIQYRTGCLNFEHEIYAGNVTGDGKVDLFVWLASQYAVGQ
jgi:hypothetical protein